MDTAHITVMGLEGSLVINTAVHLNLDVKWISYTCSEIMLLIK